MLGSGTAHEIASDPDLAIECMGVLAHLRVIAMTPATPEAIMGVLMRRFPVYPQPQRSDAQWAEWWASYLDALKGCSQASIEAAMDAYVRLSESEYFPKPGRLFALAKTKPNDAARAYSNARAVAALMDRGTAEARQHVGPEAIADLAKALARPRHAPTPSERKAVRAMADAYASQIPLVKAERPKPPQLPPVHGRVDGSGITPEMREVMGMDPYLPTPAELLTAHDVQPDPAEAEEENLDAWPT